MVATAILALIATTVYGVLWRTLDGKNRAEDRADLFAAGREAVMRMADEIERALPPTAGNNNSVYFIGVSGQDTVPNDAVGFVIEVRRDLSAGQRRGGRATVSYQLEQTPDTPGSFVLIRHEELMLDPLAQLQGTMDGQNSLDPNSSQNMDTGPLQSDTAVVDGVAGLRLRYLDPDSGNWTNAWDTTEDVPMGQGLPGLPPVVEIQLFLLDGTGSYVEFSTRIDLPLFALPQATPYPGTVQPPGS